MTVSPAQVSEKCARAAFVAVTEIPGPISDINGGRGGAYSPETPGSDAENRENWARCAGEDIRCYRSLKDPLTAYFSR